MLAWIAVIASAARAVAGLVRDLRDLGRKPAPPRQPSASERVGVGLKPFPCAEVYCDLPDGHSGTHGAGGRRL